MATSQPSKQVSASLSAQPAARQRAEYGFDAPHVLYAFALAAMVATGLGVLGLHWSLGWLAGFGFFNALWFFISALSFSWTTRVGKFAVWEELLDTLPLEGNERLLDVGCGRGAVAILAAKRLTHGKAVGVDIWSSSGQSGNAYEVPLRNAEIEGVAERLQLHTGDARELPFPDESFDVVTTSLALHHIPSESGRSRSLDEILRVLKPGGVALVADFRYTKSYYEHYLRVGNVEVSRRRLDWRFWYGGPHAATWLVFARKATHADSQSSSVSRC
jgi:arsenite methyltransferase